MKERKNNLLIVGWQESKNFGTTLQAFAFNSVLAEKYNVSLLYSRTFLNFKDFLSRLLSKNFSRQKPTCHTLLNDFNKVSLSGFKDKKFIVENFDTFIVGSDQLFNPYFIERTYFLDFVPAGKNKLSYATSLGFESIPENKYRFYKKGLKDFNSISLREKQSAENLSKIIEKEIAVCLDPVFLIDKSRWLEFSKLSVLSLPEKFIFCYFTESETRYKSRIEKLAEREKLPVLTLSLKSEGPLSEIDAKDFLNLINKSSLVVTDSFHATSFSLIFHKRVIAIKRFDENEKFNPNVRIENLIELFGLKTEGDEIKADFIEFDKTLLSLKESSLKWLYNAIDKR